MGTLVYFIKEAMRGFYQAKLMTFVSVVTIAVTLFFLGLIGIGYYNVHLWLDHASERAVLVVYLTDPVSADSTASEALIAELTEFPAVDRIMLVGKDEAWGRFSELYGPEMLDAVDENPFPASLEVVLASAHRSVEAVEKFKREIAGVEGVEGVRYSRDWLDRLEQVRIWFLLGGIAIVPILLLALHFMISNTIKLTIYARRDLVTNMHFVGATDIYIEMPFILEGMLQGLVGGLLSFSAIHAVKLGLSSFAVAWGPWYVPLAASAAVGVLFGWIGSVSAVRKFLA